MHVFLYIGQIVLPKSGKRTPLFYNQTNPLTITNGKEGRQQSSEDELHVQDEGDNYFYENVEAVLRASTSNTLPSCKGSGSDQVFEDLQSTSEIVKFARSPKSPKSTTTTPFSRPSQPTDHDKQSGIHVDTPKGKKHAGIGKRVPTKHSELLLNASKSNIELRNIHDQTIEQISHLPNMASSNSTCVNWNVQPRSRSKSLTTIEEKTRRTNSVCSRGKGVTSVRDATTVRGRSGRARTMSQPITFNGNGRESTCAFCVCGI